MSQINGKRKILRVAEELIVKNGYNTISTRRIARDAKVSIGTLYYHFPKGKLSILYEISLSYGDKFIRSLDFSKIEHLNAPEVVKDYLFKLIEQYRQFSPLIQGFEIELLTNKKILKDIQDLRESNKHHFNIFVSNLLVRFFPNIKESEKTIIIIRRIFNNLIFTHVIFENYYGTDEELVEILYRMLNGLLTGD